MAGVVEEEEQRQGGPVPGRGQHHVPGGTAPCALNAANEVAVHAFLSGRLAFTGIAEVIERTLEELPAAPVHAFDSLYEADREARAGAGAPGEAAPAR